MKAITLTACLMMASSCATTKSLDEQYIIRPMFVNDTYYIECSINSHGSRKKAMEKAIKKANEFCPKYTIIDKFVNVKTKESPGVKIIPIDRYIAGLRIDCRYFENNKNSQIIH